MADGKPPTQLNKEWLQRFKDDDIKVFRDLLKVMCAYDTKAEVLTMRTLKKAKHLDGTRYGELVPLAIGNLAKDDQSGGLALNEAVVEMVAKLDGILTRHSDLFEDIDAALEETIKTLFETQGASLEAIDGQKFFDIFEDEDVEYDLTSPPDEEGEGSGDKDKDK